MNILVQNHIHPSIPMLVSKIMVKGIRSDLDQSLSPMEKGSIPILLDDDDDAIPQNQI
jgi:hypothetical protein